MISVSNLKKTFQGNHILNGISFEAEQGELIALLGESGSGKTTLLKCLTLMEKWDDGKFTYDGEDVLSYGVMERLKFRKQWAFLEDEPRLKINKTAVRNVLGGRINQTPLWRKLTGRVEQTEHFIAMDALKKVGLLNKGHEQVWKLSGGEKQRVALTKALVQGAKVVVADEPVKGLDPISASEVMESFQKICQANNITIICSLPDIEVAQKYASRIWGLAEGKLVVDIAGRRLTHTEKVNIFGG